MSDIWLSIGGAEGFDPEDAAAAAGGYWEAPIDKLTFDALMALADGPRLEDPPRAGHRKTPDNNEGES